MSENSSISKSKASQVHKRKRVVSDEGTEVETPHAHTNTINFDAEDEHPLSDGGHNLSGSEDDEPGAAKLAPILGVGSRAFGSIDHTLQPCTKSAEKIVASETLWKKPLLTQAEILTLVHKAWRKALLELNCPRQLVMDKMVTNYLKSIHSRTRGHLVAECKRTIIKIYGISHLSQTERAKQVAYLLDGDRFICRQATRNDRQGRFRAEELGEIIYRRYFRGPKMQGNREPAFLENINGVFICFVAAAIRHCLKAWKTGACTTDREGNLRVVDFKYETAWCTYERLANTWEAHGSEIQRLLIKNLKADLARRIAVRATLIEIEPIEAPEVEDQTKYEAELRKELEESYEKLSIPPPKRQRREGSPSVNSPPGGDHESSDTDLSDEEDGCGEQSP